MEKKRGRDGERDARGRLLKGHPSLPGAGRPQGCLNRATRDLREFLSALVSDTEVQDSIKDQILLGNRGAMQGFFTAAAHVAGKPRERIEIEVSPNLSQLLLMATKRDESKG